MASLLGGAATTAASALTGNIPGAVIGGAQMLSSILKKRQANKLMPPEEDIEQRMLLNELNRKKLQLERGAGVQSQMGKGLIGRGLAQSQSNILRAGGGNVGATMQGLSMAQRQSGDATNQLLADQQQQAGSYTQMAMQLQNQIAQRKFGLQTAKYLQKLRESAELREQGSTNLQSALVRSPEPVSRGMNRPVAPSVFSTPNAQVPSDIGGIGDMASLYNPTRYPQRVPYAGADLGSAGFDYNTLEE